MDINCTFEDFIFNTGETFYQCIIKDQEIPQNLTKFDISGQHLSKKYDADVTFIEFRDCNCPKVPKGLTKFYPNLRILSICNSKLKDISKDDMTEYKNLQKFISDQNDVDFLPGDLFDDFDNLDYIKFTGNKLGIIEPNLLDNLHKLDYINFKSNPNIHQFAANNPVYERNINASIADLKRSLSFNFLNSDQKSIKNYVLKFPDSDKVINSLKECSNGYEAKMNLLDVRHEIYDETRIRDVEELKEADEKLSQTVAELKSLNAKLSMDVQELQGTTLKLSQQLDEYKKELDREKDGHLRLKRNFQGQIDNLVRQFQAIMSDGKSA